MKSCRIWFSMHLHIIFISNSFSHGPFSFQIFLRNVKCPVTVFIYWHLFHCAVTYMYMYMSIYFVFIETNYNKYYILSCIVFLIPKYTLNQSFKCSPSIIYLLYEISTFISLVIGVTDFHLTFNSYKQCIDHDLWL